MDGWVKIGTELDTKNFDAQIKYVENQMQEIEDKLKQADMGFEVGDTTKLEAQYEKLSQSLTTLKTKQLEVGKTDFSNVSKSISNVKDNIDSVIKKVARWALAVFGIRSAYLAVRRAASTLTEYNDQIKSDLDYITYAMANALEPIVQWLINGAYKVLGIINSITIQLFHFNLFANSSANAFESANKSAEKLKKTTAGFDEMNILNDNTSTSAVSPSVDLSKLQGNIPSWIQWIIDNGPFLISIIGGIAGAIGAIKISGLLNSLEILDGKITALKALGIGVLIAGIILLIEGVIDYLKDPSWENFGNIVKGIGVILLGLAAIFGSIPLLIAAAIAIIVSMVLTNWNTIKGYLQGAYDWIMGIIDFIEKRFGIFGTTIVEPIRSAINIIKDIFTGLFTGIKNILDGIILIFKGNFKDGIVLILKGIANVIIGILNALIDGINGIVSPIRALIVAIGKVTGKGWTMDNIKIPTIRYLKTGAIINQPNTGVPLANNVRGGEAGIEGVIPLTDSQAMDTLGSSIGRHITINATIENKMDGKTISRQIKKINNNTNFVMNR